MVIGLHATNLVADMLSLRDVVALQRVCRYTDAVLDREKLKKRCREEWIPLEDINKLFFVAYRSGMRNRDCGYFLRPNPRYHALAVRRRLVEPPTSDIDFWVVYRHFAGHREQEDWVMEDGTPVRMMTWRSFPRGLYGLRLGKKEDARRQAVIDEMTLLLASNDTE